MKGASGAEVKVDFSLLTASSVVFDAVYVPGGEKSAAALAAEPDALEFVSEAFRHCKTVGATGDGVAFVLACPGVPKSGSGDGLVLSEDAKGGSFTGAFIKEIGKHRHWSRATRDGGLAPPPKATKTGKRARQR